MPDDTQTVEAPMHPNPDLYVQDFYTWCLEQATLLEARDADALDWEHLAEEMMEQVPEFVKNRLHLAMSEQGRFVF